MLMRYCTPIQTPFCAVLLDFSKTLFAADAPSLEMYCHVRSFGHIQDSMSSQTSARPWWHLSLCMMLFMVWTPLLAHEIMASLESFFLTIGIIYMYILCKAERLSFLQIICQTSFVWTWYLLYQHVEMPHCFYNGIPSLSSLLYTRLWPN